MWIFIICIITSSSIAYGIYIQKSAYQNNFDKYKKMQNIVPIFNWLNNNTAKDSVILVVNDKHEKYAKQLMAFTNNNLYAGSFIFTLMPQERITHNYMVDLKMQGVAPKKLKQYISHNLVMHKHYFGGLTDWKNTQITKKYLRDKDIVLNLYPEFYKQNLYTELKKYRLNYILSKDKLNVSIKKQLPQLVFIKEINGFYIYELL